MCEYMLIYTHSLSMFIKDGKMNQPFVPEQVSLHETNMEINEKDMILSCHIIIVI